PMPFDGKRMIFGGFEQVVEVKASTAVRRRTLTCHPSLRASGANCRPAGGFTSRPEAASGKRRLSLKQMCAHPTAA
ncbi:MAG TPA: hypothetical protein VGJ75_22470, partial [Dongiaceae bacterium]